jgi:hypothetical protein
LAVAVKSSREGPVVVKTRTVREIKPKPGKDFVYRRVYVDVGKGEISEYNFSEKTSLLTHDATMGEYAKKSCALLPEGEDVCISLSLQNVFRVERYSAGVDLIPTELLDELPQRRRVQG